MTSTTVEKPLDLVSVRNMFDPEKQLESAAKVIDQSERALEPHRLRRNSAAVLIFRRANAQAIAQGLAPADWPMQPAAMWKETIEVSRSGWHKIMREADPALLQEITTELAAKRAEIAELSTDRAAELPQLSREEAKLAHRLARHQAQITAIEEMCDEIDADPAVGEQLLAIARIEAAEVHRLEETVKEAMQFRDRVAVKLLNGELGRPIPNVKVAKLAGLSTARVAQLRNTRFTE